MHRRIALLCCSLLTLAGVALAEPGTAQANSGLVKARTARSVRTARAPRSSPLRDLGPVDLQVGSIQGFNEVTNGFADALAYVEAARREVSVPNHHDD